MFLTLLIYTFAAFGLAYIVGHSRISLPIRQRLADFTVGEPRFVCKDCGIEDRLSRYAREPYDYEEDKQVDQLTCRCGSGKIEQIAKGRQPFMLFVELLECPACFGTWIGMIVGIIGILYLTAVSRAAPTTLGYLIGAFVGATYTAGTNYTLAKLTKLVE